MGQMSQWREERRRSGFVARRGGYPTIRRQPVGGRWSRGALGGGGRVLSSNKQQGGGGSGEGEGSPGRRMTADDWTKGLGDGP